MGVTFALLSAAIVALWLRRGSQADNRGGPMPGLEPWLVLYACAVAAALVTGIARPLALVWIVAFAAMVWLWSRTGAPRTQRIAASIGLIGLAAGLMAHQLPGFNNPRVITAATYGAEAIPYRLHLNFDKPIVGLFLLGWCHARLRQARDWRTMLAGAAPVAGGLICALLLISLAMGYVRFEPKFPREWWLWAWANLLLTCVAEEAFFRGFIQARLHHAWRNRRAGAWLALGAAAVLFGLAHAGGGLAYVVLATLAGAGYGWAYLRTGHRIEASILTHFALNATHFLLFTYPALRRG